MEKTLKPVKVYTNENCIYIEQQWDFDSESTIILCPDQIDLLINWLTQAKNEFQMKEKVSGKSLAN